jgi:hypothetical protein
MRSIPVGASGTGGSIGYGSYGAVGHGYGSSMPVMGKAYAAPSVRVASAIVVGDLDKDIIRRYIRRQIARIRYCYEKQLKTKPGLSGKVTVRFVLGDQGKVIEATASGLGNAAVETCVAEVIRSIEFPATRSGGQVVINYPFLFQPGKVE